MNTLTITCLVLVGLGLIKLHGRSILTTFVRMQTWTTACLLFLLEMFTMVWHQRYRLTLIHDNLLRDLHTNHGQTGIDKHWHDEQNKQVKRLSHVA